MQCTHISTDLIRLIVTFAVDWQKKWESQINNNLSYVNTINLCLGLTKVLCINSSLFTGLPNQCIVLPTISLVENKKFVQSALINWTTSLWACCGDNRNIVGVYLLLAIPKSSIRWGVCFYWINWQFPNNFHIPTIKPRSLRNIKLDSLMSLCWIPRLWMYFDIPNFGQIMRRNCEKGKNHIVGKVKSCDLRTLGIQSKCPHHRSDNYC